MLPCAYIAETIRNRLGVRHKIYKGLEAMFALGLF